MAQFFTWNDGAGTGLNVWDQWQSACDACGRLESSLKNKQLLSCAGCLLAKYCSVRYLISSQFNHSSPIHSQQKECQKQDWSKGSHKNRCHLFEADRKLSTVFAKSLGPGTINDPALSLADKATQWYNIDARPSLWNFLNSYNHVTIAAAASKYSPEIAKTANVGIFVKFVADRTGSKYDHRTFIIEKVGLLSRESSDAFVKEHIWTNGLVPPETIDIDHSKVLVGFCRLPNTNSWNTQMWSIPIGPRLTELVLPPGFDLHRYITHVNRGITHFHASFWPLPRNISDADLKGAPIPKEWINYAHMHFKELSGLKGQCVIGVENPDGTRTPMYKLGQNGHFRRCAPGETDTDGPEEYRKLLVDPSRMMCFTLEITWFSPNLT
ncbi:hypothetical protein C8R43DRAFT_948012 [Mycena crocata]|nr:hypothetical protein C8R43DRAFT_948012 [Mycena crocata]